MKNSNTNRYLQVQRDTTDVARVTSRSHIDFESDDLLP